MKNEAELSPELVNRAEALSAAFTALLVAAFHEGQTSGVGRMRATVHRICETMLRDLERAFAELSAEGIAMLEEGYRSATPAPLVAAHFGAAADALTRVRSAIDGASDDDAAASDEAASDDAAGSDEDSCPPGTRP